MENLPAEMQEKITNRLNLRDLSRLRSVDKYHFDLIEYPTYEDRMMFLTKSVLKKINELHYLDPATRMYVFHKISNGLEKSKLNTLKKLPVHEYSSPKSQSKAVSKTFEVFDLILKLDYLDPSEKYIVINAIIQDSKPFLSDSPDYDRLLDYLDLVYAQEYYGSEESEEVREDISDDFEANMPPDDFSDEENNPYFREYDIEDF